jgi:hypothetical protein
MEVDKINQISKYQDEISPSYLEYKLEEGKKKGASHLILYYDRFNRDELIRLVFPYESLDEVKTNILNDYCGIIKVFSL